LYQFVQKVRWMAQEETMAYKSQDEDEVIAACALCPNQECSSLIIAYVWECAHKSKIWDFECLRCGNEFSVSEEDLIFQAVPLELLLAKLPHIAHA
jgi:hypothetical protein